MSPLSPGLCWPLAGDTCWLGGRAWPVLAQGQGEELLGQDV